MYLTFILTDMPSSKITSVQMLNLHQQFSDIF